MSLKRGNKWERGEVGVERPSQPGHLNTIGVYINGRKFIDI